MATVTKLIGSGQEYTTIQAFFDDLDADPAYSASDDAVGEIQDSAAFNEPLTCSLGAALNSITLTVASDVRHEGTAGSGARVIQQAKHVFSTDVQMIVQWLEFDWNAWNSTEGMSVSAPRDLRLENCILHNIEAARTSIVTAVVTGGDAGIFMYNCLVYHIRNTGSGGTRGINADGGGSTNLSNCTVTDIGGGSGTAYGIFYEGADADHTLENNLVTDVSSSGTNDCYSDAAPSSSTTTNNVSDDATSPESGHRNATIAFQNAAGDDYRLASGDTDAIDMGTDLGAGNIAIDLLGRNRDTAGDNWDAGAFERVVGGQSVVPILVHGYSRFTGGLS